MIEDQINAAIIQLPLTVQSFLEDINYIGSTYLTGSFIRDIALYNLPPKIKEIDILIDVYQHEEFKQMFESLEQEKGANNGYKIYIEGVYIYIWEIKNTLCLKHNRIPPTINNYLEFTTFNLDSIVFNYTTDMIHTYHFDDFVDGNRIEVLSKKFSTGFIYNQVNAGRIDELSDKYGSTFGPVLKSVMKCTGLEGI